MRARIEAQLLYKRVCMDLKSNYLCFSFERYNTVTHTLYMRQFRSNSLHKHFGDIKRTPLREVLNFIVAFQRKTEIVFVLNLNPYRFLFFSTSALVKLGSKQVYVSASVNHNYTQFYGISRWLLPWLKIVNEQTVFWVAIAGDLPYV